MHVVKLFECECRLPDGISRTFGPVQALDAVDAARKFSCACGDVYNRAMHVVVYEVQDQQGVQA